MGLYALLTTGEAVGRKFCYEEIPTRLDPFDEAAFEASPVDFYVTVTNVRTGRAEHILCPDLRQGGGMEVLRAGASMPLCSRITMIGGQPLPVTAALPTVCPTARQRRWAAGAAWLC